MHITFVGGPWHVTAKAYDPPLPASVSDGSSAIYVPWCEHPATAVVLAPALEHAPTYVLATLTGPALLDRVLYVLLHFAAGNGPCETPDSFGLEVFSFPPVLR